MSLVDNKATMRIMFVSVVANIEFPIAFAIIRLFNQVNKILT